MSSRADRLWLTFGQELRDARLERRLTVRDLAARAGISAGMVYRIEAGHPASTDVAGKVATALGRRAELHLVDPRKRANSGQRWMDPVHSLMGECEARHFRAFGRFGLGLDEPYQHFQFAGRADFVAWDLDQRALLHIENRTRFPDFQEMAGAFNAKRAYLAESIGERLKVASCTSQTHVIAALWSSEVLHALRLRTDSFQALCPDGPEDFAGWWRGDPPSFANGSTLIVLDPLASGRQAPWIDLTQVATARPRHHGYADVAIQASGNIEPWP